MGIYLPTAAVGNGQVLATLGGAGEIMTFFYPHIDFAQNVHECLPALYLGEPGHGEFMWTFSPQFQRRQRYLSQTNVLITELDLATRPLKLTFRDFCPPQTDALVRIVTVKNTGDDLFRGAFLHYFDLNLGEAALKQAVRYVPEEGYVIQYFRDIVLAVGGTRPGMWRCGKSIDQQLPSSAKSDMYDGHLNGQPEDIGQVDFALGYHLELAPGEETEIEILISAAESSQRSAQRFLELRTQGVPRLLESAITQDRNWLAQRRPVSVEPRLQEAYQRALLALPLLCDAREHSFVAAPEFDPHYLRCGGYGYCWPRDAAAAALALDHAGFSSYLAGLSGWLAKVQFPSGLWGQRYWAEGQLAPSWSLREDFHQIDQSASALHALATYLCSLPEDVRGPACAEYWDTVERAAEALVENIGDDGWHQPACDLWETYCGTFVYSNAAIYAALRAAARCARLAAQDKLAGRWEQVADSTRQAVLSSCRDGYFPRGRLESGWEDPVVDSSTLGLVEPFALLSPLYPDQRQMIESNLATIQVRLTSHLDGGVGIRRYEGDGYLGGVIGGVNTLWAAWVCLRVAESYRGKNEERAAHYRQQALDYLDFCLDHATPTGLLPELIGTDPNIPYWAAPHSWASGLLVECILALDELER